MSPFEVLSYPIFETEEVRKEVLACVAKAKEEGIIPPEKIWMGTYFDKELQEGGRPPISIRFVDEEVGKGVFAEKKNGPEQLCRGV